MLCVIQANKKMEKKAVQNEKYYDPNISDEPSNITQYNQYVILLK